MEAAIPEISCAAARPFQIAKREVRQEVGGVRAEPAEDLGDERDDLLASREGVRVVTWPPLLRCWPVMVFSSCGITRATFGRYVLFVV